MSALNNESPQELEESGGLYELAFAEKVAYFPSTGDLQIPTYDWGGDGPPLVVAHATGLHAHAYLPLVAHLRSQFHCYGIDVRGQGDAGIPSDGNFTWDGVTQDFVRALDGLGLSGRGDVYGVGHSQGGYSVIQAALSRPGTFAGLFGFEPVIFALPEGVKFVPEDTIMIKQALKRRQVFGSREEAYLSYKSKPPFMLIDDDALRAYIAWGFDDLPDGTVRIKCTAASEAALFTNAQTKTIHHLHEVDCRVVLGLSGYAQQTFLDSVPEQHARLRNSELMHFPGRTHFGILEGIGEMAGVISTALLGR